MAATHLKRRCRALMCLLVWISGFRITARSGFVGEALQQLKFRIWAHDNAQAIQANSSG